MRRHTRSALFITFLSLGMTALVLELDYLLPMSGRMHQLLLVGGILLLLATAAMYIYQRSRTTNTADAWWKDDDWTHWGGI